MNNEAITKRSMKTQSTVVGVMVMLFFVAGCSKKEERQQVDLVTFPLKGEVVSVDMQKHRVMVAHEEIPNYMMAMTMPFKVKDTTLLLGLEPGDSIQATLAVSRTESWLETITVIGKDETQQSFAVRDAVFKRLFKEGEPFPKVALINKDGKNIQLSDYRGKVLAFTFIYTRCPLPDFCIRMSDQFAQVQTLLKTETDLVGQWQLLTISFDPEFDKPEVLKRYGKNYGADFATWEFATGSMETIRAMANGLDLTLDDDEGGMIAHNLRTVVVDQNGTLVKIIKGNEWTANDVVKEIRLLIKRPA